MKVIIIKGIGKLNKEEEVAEVKDGYARNFLIPQGYALRATKENFKKLETIKRKKTKLEENKKDKIGQLKEKIEAISLTIAAQVKEGEEIYGSVTESQILKLLKEEGVELVNGKIRLDEPIKKIGVYNLKIDLHPEITANLRVWVVKK